VIPGMVKSLPVLIGLSVFIGAPVCGAEGPVTAFVSIVPQKYFVEKIGGPLVDVSVMVVPGESPATYEPKPGQMVKLSRAELYFAIGVPFESVWLEKIAGANPEMKIVDTQRFIGQRPVKRHHHGEQRIPQHNAHGILDPHIWLSPPLVMLLARNILTALQEVDPVHREEYASNYKAFITQLVDLDEEIRELFHGIGERNQFMVYHPAWGYFADAYGLEQVPVELEGKEPKPAQVAQLIDTARARGIHVLFVQPQFSSRSARTIADAIDGTVVTADPLAADWDENLLRVARAIHEALPRP
jgi:zinc transport system substrate-binding protein